MVNHKNTNSPATDFPASFPEMSTIQGDDPVIESLLNAIRRMSASARESIYVIDLRERRFLFVADHTHLLCNHLVKDALRLGFDFLYRAMLRYMQSSDFPMDDDTAYFSCTFRLRDRQSPVMVYHTLMPLPCGGRVRYAVCRMTASVVKTQGNLILHCEGNRKQVAYNRATKKWMPATIKCLDEREKEVLVLLQQGKTGKEIADILCISIDTLQKVKSHVFQKLDVTSTAAAITYAVNHCLLFPVEQHIDAEGGEPSAEKKSRKTRQLLTPSMLMHIQAELDKGLSIRYVAKVKGVSEGAIRYAISQSKLVNPFSKNSFGA